MENILPIHLSEVIFSSSNSQISKQITKLEKAGKLRKIASRIYTPNFTDSSEIIIRRNLFMILGELYPNALLSHRSALEFKPTSAGHIFLTYTYTKKINLSGITLRFMEGHAAIEGDNRVSGELFASQIERALLENLQVSRQVGSESKTLTLPEIEDKLEEIIRVKGEKELNELRDRARVIAEKLDMKSEFEKLNKLISALLSTQPSKILSSPLAIARAFGNPYDPIRLSLFEKLFVELKQQEFITQPEKNISNQSFRNFAFFEAYFSNYIEGTEFELEDAKRIIETNAPMPTRDEDSHDMLGTYKLVSNKTEMALTPTSPEKMLEILLYRHKILLNARTSMKPGQFKDKNNRAGETHFVDYTLVKGTLIKGFDYYQVLTNPFARAIYMMFLISEVHPFLDGNGRIARVMMNAELVKGEQTKIIIPTVYRDDYVGALRLLTRKNDPSAYIRMMQKAWIFSATIFGDDINAMENHLKESNTFKEHDTAKLKIISS
ncbi:MAG: cell filamentation protein Fic [Bacteroidetes bacterium]|nr:MAG: cell filamentation protein Fic [Bacteroidota bacterium]